MSKKINENLLYHFGNKAINSQEKERIRTIIIKQYVEDERFLSSFIQKRNHGRFNHNLYVIIRQYY